MPKRPSQPEKPNALEQIFHIQKPIIGMVHLRPLPGSPSYDGEFEKIIHQAVRDARALETGGVDGLIIENFMDRPFLKPDEIGHETVAAMTVAANEVRRSTGLPMGINCLANGVLQSISVAAATGSSWIRANLWANAYIADEGYIEAAAPKGLRHRSNVRANYVKIFADVQVKHGSHFIISDRPLEEQVRDIEFFDADALIVTGSRTGVEPSLQELGRVKATASIPVLIGSGLNPVNAPKLLPDAHGAIVGTYFKERGEWWRPVDVARVKKLVEEVSRIRKTVARS